MHRCAVLALLGPLLVAVGCERDDPCTDTGTCRADMRCEVPEGDRVGICIPCDEAETPYDGIDNDCIERTRDFDLDQDGDNWIDAPIRPGTDCNDNDPTSHLGAPERCDDDRDNNCDGVVDEPQCVGQSSPIVRISAPFDQALVFGPIDIVVVASDDVGLETVQLIGPRGIQLGQADRPPYTFAIDTRTLDDGPVTIVARATDVAGLSSSAQIEIYVDNKTGPTVTVMTGPSEGSHYGGSVRLRLAATDPSGVARIDILVDTITVATSSASTISTYVDTRLFADGIHELSFVAVDGRGSISRQAQPLIVDNTPPVITFVAPLDGAELPVGVHVFDVTASDVAGALRIWINDQAVTGGALRASVNIRAGLQTVTASAADIVTVDGQLRGNVGARSITVRGVAQ